jgi:dolichol kinase
MTPYRAADEPTKLVVRDRGSLHLERRLFHMSAGVLFPVLALTLEERLFFALLLATSVVMVGGDVTRLLVPSLNRLFVCVLAPLMRSEEMHGIVAASYGLLGILGVFVLFDRDIAVVAVLFLALGDPVAAIVGIRLRRGPVFGKSLSGSVAMATAALAVVAVLHATGAVDFRLAFDVGAAPATAIELLPLPLNDNFTIPLGAGASITLMGI